jgi:MoxR-like ATPase
MERRYAHPSGYRADPGLIDAVNVALQLGQPLLLTGQPGTGKTQAAHSIAWELGFGEVLKFETKSTSAARDLFYAYDALGRFRAAQATGSDAADALSFMQFGALGQAILEANPRESVAHLLSPDAPHAGPRRSVVLIDEIDKAPRDFPNDLLNEVEHMYFRIPELGNQRVDADPNLRPVLVLTSNSEKNLAEAFLRRCVFYHLPFPEPDRLRDIVLARLGEQIVENRGLLDTALDLFARLRDPLNGLAKRPSTSELLNWLRLLVDGPMAAADSTLRDPRIIGPTLATLIKTVDDRTQAETIIRAWQDT